MWIKKEDSYPEQDGVYKVKMHTGSMRPIVIEMESRFFLSDFGRPHFQGERDWNYVMEWWKEE